MTREQLEQQSEHNRAAVADTLGELNKRLTPGEIVDEVMSYMKGGGNEFLANLGKQITDNPMPVTLMGAGLAWFLFAKNGGPNIGGLSADMATGNGASNAKTTSSGIGEAAGAAAGKIEDMASATADGVSGAMHAIGDAASSAYHQTADTLGMAKNSAKQAEERTLAAAHSAIAFCQEQPLVLAGIGLALGAAIGAALPSTELEDRLMGDTSDELKESAKDIAVDQLDKAKAVGEKIGEAFQDDKSVDEDERQPSAGYAPQSGNSEGAGMH
jgi:hypothetical protein